MGYMVTLYNVVSADGFIAREDGSEDFIPESYWPHTLAVLKQYDCVMLGRKAYEAVQSYEEELISSLEQLPVRKVVVTRDKSFHAKQGYEIAHSPEEVIKPGMNILVVSGPTLNNYLLSKNLVNKITYHEVPVSIGSGIKPYDSVPDSVEVVKLPIAERI